MAFSEDLLKKFILALEHTKIPVGGDVAIRLQHIFNLLNITTADELAKQKFVIGPVIARSPEEQHRFYSAFDQFVESCGVKKPEVITPIAEEVNKNVKNARWRALAVSLLILGAYIFYEFVIDNPPVTDPEINFEWRDSAPLENGEIIFKNLSEVPYKYSSFDWYFGDSTATLNIKDTHAVIHVYRKPGQYIIKLTAYSATDTFPPVIKKITIGQDTVCHVSPNFYTRNNPSSKLKITFINTSIGECIERYKWSFNDGSSDIEITNQASDTLSHLFSKEGAYRVQLTAFTKDTFYNHFQTIQVNDQPAFISLQQFEPILLFEKPPVVLKKGKPIGMLILFCFLLIILPFIFAAVSYHARKKNLTRIFKNEYPLADPPLAPYTYQIDDHGLSIQSERKLGELAFRLRNPEQGDAIRLNIQPTIAETIRSAGYPKLIFNETTTQPSYVALIDLDSGVSQQVQLFRELLGTLEMYRVNFALFYFRGSMQTCFSDAYPDGISIDKIAELYATSRLIIYSNGASLLHANSIDGFVSWAPKLFNRWKNKAIITPVPRYNWDENERQLFKLFPVYPAGLNGHLVMAKGFIKGRHRMFIRKKTEPWLSPFPADIELYREYFLRDGEQKLFLWLLALSVPEKTDWNTTLLVGKIVEDQLCIPGERLVTYGNLLRLTSVEWLQDGNLSSYHRLELYNELKKQPGAEDLINAVNRELLREIEKSSPQENSAAAIERKIQLALLNYQLNSDKKAVSHEHEMHFLAQAGLLSRFAKTEIYKEKKGFSRFNPRKAIIAASVGLLLLGLIFIPGFRNIVDRINPAPYPAADTLIDSTAAFFNNKAVELIRNTPPGFAVPENAAINLRKAYSLDSLNDTIHANIQAFRYRQGLNLYREGKFLDAADVFGFYPGWKYVPTQEIQKDPISQAVDLLQEGARDMALYNEELKLSESPTNQGSLFLKHAQGVCSYYIWKYTNNDSFLVMAKKIDSILVRFAFYSIYADKNNLNTLLQPGAINSGKKFKLVVTVESDWGKVPLVRVKASDQQEVGRGYNKLNLPLLPGDYIIYVDNIPPRKSQKIVVHLSNDTTITVPLGGMYENLRELGIRVSSSRSLNSTGTKKVQLYDMKSNKEVVNDYMTDYYVTALPPGKYKYSISYLNSIKLSEGQLYLTKDTTIDINVVDPKKINIHVNDVEGRAAVGVTISNTDTNIPYGKTDNNGNLSFEIDPDKFNIVHIELSKGNHKKTTAINPKNGENMYEISLEDYTGYTVVLFPSDTAGQRLAGKDADLYQRAMVEAMQKLYPKDKFVRTWRSDKTDEGEVSRPYPGAIAILNLQLVSTEQSVFLLGTRSKFSVTIEVVGKPSKSPKFYVSSENVDAFKSSFEFSMGAIGGAGDWKGYILNK